MAIVYCHDCKKVLISDVKGKERAAGLARLHMAATPHIMVFGYTDQEAKKQGLI